MTFQGQWTDEETKKAALDTLDLLNNQMMRPGEDNELEKFYDFLEINPGSYLESVQNLTLFMNDKYLAGLILPVEKINDSSNCLFSGVNLGKTRPRLYF